MDDNYLTINEQGLVEVSPTASANAQQEFIDAYRQTQGENTAQIGEQAHALGSDLEASLGGLHGPSEYMKSRYQTPQTESRLANLRAAAQLSALNQLMSNDLANWADKYSQAYRNAKANVSTPTKTPSGNVNTINSDEYNAQTTLGISSEDWSSRNLPAGANRITRVGDSSLVYDANTKQWVPGYVDTADNTDGSMRDTVVSRTENTMGGSYTPEQYVRDAANVLQKAQSLTIPSMLLTPWKFVQTLQGAAQSAGGQ